MWQNVVGCFQVSKYGYDITISCKRIPHPMIRNPTFINTSCASWTLDEAYQLFPLSFYTRSLFLLSFLASLQVPSRRPPNFRHRLLWTFFLIFYWGMPADISADLAYLGGVWAEGVLYGNNLNFFKWFNSVDLLLSRYPVSLNLSLKHSPWSVYASSIIIFFTLLYIFTSSAYTRGREKSSQ